VNDPGFGAVPRNWSECGWFACDQEEPIMANKQHNTPENKRRPNAGFKNRGPLSDGEAINEDADDLPPYAAGEELGDEDDLLSDEDVNKDNPDDYRNAGKREH
jgi:hypothetical protein